MMEAPPQTAWEQHRGKYTISTDAGRFDLNVIHGYLQHAYWCEGIQREIVERSVHNSLCFALFEGEKQIGFARVITDRATFAYLCDVFVLDACQGRGLGSWLLQCVTSHPELLRLRRWHLLTRDAHGLYRKVGFTELAQPERHMELLAPKRL